MLNFNYYTPTEVLFGDNSQQKVVSLIKQYKGSKVLIVIGQGSVKRSGLLDEVYGLLDHDEIEYQLLEGVQENPLLSKIEEGVEIVKKHKLNFILAIGGGSVIDTAKAVAAGVYEKENVWDIVGNNNITKALPVGVILTIAAAGSEMSSGAVITQDETKLKRDFGGRALRPVFAILNPTLTYSLNEYQTACGIADIIMHTLERYFTNSISMEITDEISRVLIQNMIKQADIVKEDPHNFAARAEIMWSGSLSHNGLTGARGDGGDWAVHNLSHEISAKYDVTHGQALTALWSTWAHYVYKENPERFAKFAVEIMNVDANGKSDSEIIDEGISKMDDFFKSLNLKTSLHELELNITDNDIEEMSLKASHNNTITLGNIKALTLEDMKNIYNIANASDR